MYTVYKLRSNTTTIESDLESTIALSVALLPL